MSTENQRGNITVKCKTCMVENVPDCPKCWKLAGQISRAVDFMNLVDNVVRHYCDSTVDVFGAKEESDDPAT